MSFETLQADRRYQDLKRELDANTRELDIANPALIDGRVTLRADRIVAAMVAIAGEHGWNADLNQWGTRPHAN